ncbi:MULTISPECIES: nitrate- and nitrite sensing domain-containing protein [unclassified Streptomyces]|uniref:sensor histidine kinase n=1 Tax=unclassified Streptomyces TaxID=2593676 RepID=UPI0033D12BF3
MTGRHLGFMVDESRLRAPVQNKRPRGKDGETVKGATGAARPVRVRTRLVTSVALVSLTVLGAGAPALLTASSDLNESQRLVTLAELDQQAVTLAHALADERDDLTAYIAGGRDPREDAALKDRATRVDRRIDEIRATAPAALGRDLATVPSLRRTALTGKGTALEAHRTYSDVIGKLLGLADELAARTPPRAAGASRAPADLGRAVEQASATRGLLVAALSVPQKATAPVYDPITGRYVQKDAGDGEEGRTRDALSAAGQQARVREQAALADFDQAAPATAREKLSTTVTGPDVDAAERYLARLTDQPQLSSADRRLGADKVAAALTARIDRMRGTESALAAAQVKQFESLRDDDVTGLELRVALVGALLLLAVGISSASARSLTRPLAVLRRGAARLASAPETEEPVRFTGRNDEFAQVVRSLNTLHDRLREHAGRADTVAAQLDEAREDRTNLAAERAELAASVRELTAQVERARGTVQHTFVNLGLRSLGLVERQLGIIEGLEEREQDPDQLATLFKLDHMATVIRRHGENLLVLAGAEHHHNHPGPVPLVDVLRAAVSEIERYERVVIQALPSHAQVAGFAADDLSHLVAELLENATSFSPPDAQVQLSGWQLESGEVMLSVQDEGIGVSPARRTELNMRLADPSSYEPGEPGTESGGLGLHVAALLARRHGVRIELREQKQGGLAAVVVLPEALLPKTPPAAPPHAVPAQSDAPRFTLPGALAEANSNVLPERAERTAQIPLPKQTPAPAQAPVPADAEAEAAAATEAETEAEAEAHERVDEPTFEMRLPAPSADETEPETEAAPETAPAPAPETKRRPDTAPEPEPSPAVPAQRVTDKGLPKRTPKVVKSGPAAPAPRKGGAEMADALRKRLGGFQQGALEGRRHAETEIQEVPRTPSEEEQKNQRPQTGETVEEARS